MRCEYLLYSEVLTKEKEAIYLALGAAVPCSVNHTELRPSHRDLCSC